MNMMRRAFGTFIVAVVLLAVSAGVSHATEVGRGRRFGLGFILGDPTGLSAKYYLSERSALDFGLGFGGYGYGHCWRDADGNKHCGYDGRTSFNADYLWQMNLVHGSGVDLDGHLGVGGRIWFFHYGDNRYRDRTFDIAARAPIGLDLMFNRPNFLEVFLEVAPSLYFLDIAFTVEGGIGLRFYF